MKLEQELTMLLNRHSVENESDTPDFVLAEYMCNCLKAWNRAMKQRDNFTKDNSDEEEQ